MSKPIEEGCLALVLVPRPIPNSPNTGLIVRVGKYIGNLPLFHLSDLWEVDKPVQWMTFGDAESWEYVIPEKYLQRIDEDDTADEQDHVQVDNQQTVDA